jgi:hypothetical protein
MEELPRSDINFKQKISDELINNHHSRKCGIREKTHFQNLDAIFEQTMINFDFENDDDRLSIHMPKSKLKLMREESMMTAPSRP